MLRIMIVGNSGVGKTSIFNQLTSTNHDSDDDISCMEPQISPTIGVNLKILKHYTSTRHQHYLNVMLMDTCGISHFQSINLQYLHGTHAYMVVFDTANRDSFIGAQQWIRRILEHHGVVSQQVVILLVGNTLQQGHPIPPSDITDFATHYGISYIQYNPTAPTSLSWFRRFVKDAFNQDTLNSCVMPTDQPSLVSRWC